MTSQLLDLPALRDAAARFLVSFLDPARAAERTTMTLALRPADLDYERVFAKEVAPLARQLYADLWAGAMPPISGKPEQTMVITWACPSHQLGSEVGRRFPGGYAKIVTSLAPGVPWFCWKFVAPGKTFGTAYDGLVQLDDRWLWFPKPWRVLGSAATPPPIWND